MPLARSPRSKSITDNSDATDLFFTDFFIWLSLFLDFYAPVRRFDFYGFLLHCGVYTDFLCSGQSAPYGRKYNPKYIQDQVNLRIKKIREKIKSVASELSVSHFERVRTEP